MDVNNLNATIYEKEGNIARVILNKPDKLNAMNLIPDFQITKLPDCLIA